MHPFDKAERSEVRRGFIFRWMVAFTFKSQISPESFVFDFPLFKRAWYDSTDTDDTFCWFTRVKGSLHFTLSFYFFLRWLPVTFDFGLSWFYP
jgi:hypothetical protein